MAGLVLELQADAMSTKIRVSDLLRKALTVSRKLGIVDIQEWINQELHGYGDAEPPGYRRFITQLKVHNPYRGWQPLFVEDGELARALASVQVVQSVGEIEELVRGGADGKLIVYPFSPDQEHLLMRSMELSMRPSRHISSNQLHGIFEAVRNRVLEWALGLEEKGIIGEGMAFTKEERAVATTSPQF